MRLVSLRHQANKVLIDKRKYQFSWTILVWQVTRNRQIFTAVGSLLLRKSRFQDRPNNLFLEVSKDRIIWPTSQVLYTQQWKHCDDFSLAPSNRILEELQWAHFHSYPFAFMFFDTFLITIVLDRKKTFAAGSGVCCWFSGKNAFFLS